MNPITALRQTRSPGLPATLPETMMSKFYLLYSSLVAGGLFYSGLTGWSFGSYDEVKGVPKSVRDNPGAYRSHYASSARYFGGK